MRKERTVRLMRLARELLVKAEDFDKMSPGDYLYEMSKYRLEDLTGAFLYALEIIQTGISHGDGQSIINGSHGHEDLVDLIAYASKADRHYDVAVLDVIYYIRNGAIVEDNPI